MDTVKVFDNLDRRIEKLLGRLKQLETDNEKLRAGLCIRGVALPTFFRLVKIVRNVQGGEDRDLGRIDRRRTFRHFLHPGIHEAGQVVNVGAVPLGPDAVRLSEDLDLSHAAPLIQIETLTPFPSESSALSASESTRWG